MTLVISDTHLGKYDRKKNLFLRNLIKDYDKVIINGDFWDNWGTSFKDFINSDYRDLFKLLKSKETIYIYGNHDYRAEKQKKLANIFSDTQGIEYNAIIGGKNFHFEHGHRFFYNQKKVIFINYYYIIDKIPLLGPLVYAITQLIYYLFPGKVSKNKISIKRNQYIKERKPKNIYYVVSHTHIPEMDKEKKFINTGCIMGRFASYLVIDNDGEPELIRKLLN